MKVMMAAGVMLAALAPSPLWACATCFGKSDSAMAQGMNWGIFTLLGVIVTVLATIASFFRLHHPQGNGGGQQSPRLRLKYETMVWRTYPWPATAGLDQW
ncbi:MAG: hypothetical protein WDN00_03640 [Limisphaerales bacterium]